MLKSKPMPGEGSCSGRYLFTLQFEPDGLLLKKECLFDRNGSALLHFEKFLRREEKREQREEEEDDDMSIIRTKSPFFQPGPTPEPLIKKSIHPRPQIPRPNDPIPFIALSSLFALELFSSIPFAVNQPKEPKTNISFLFFQKHNRRTEIKLRHQNCRRPRPWPPNARNHK